MAFTTAKLTELPLRTSLPFTSPKTPSLYILRKPLCAIRTTTKNDNNTVKANSNLQTPKPPLKSAPWLSKWPPSSNPPFDKIPDKPNAGDESDGPERRPVSSKDKGQNAIERIVLRLRNLGLGVEDEETEGSAGEVAVSESGSVSVIGEEKLGDLLRREWVRPDAMLEEEEEGEDDEMALPWEREEKVEEEVRGVKTRRPRAPTLAELTLEDEELRRLRRMGMYLRERINVPKAGLTKDVMDKINDKWRKQELVRLKFHEVLALDMKTAHEITERRTGGLVIWRSGSVMVVYRGTNYEGPSSRSQHVAKDEDPLFVPNVSAAINPSTESASNATSTLEKVEPAVSRSEKMTEEEAEFNSLLDGLGPRFVEWWGTGVLPVDADLLPPKVPGYKTPFRLLPTGMRSTLTNAEMTNLRKLAKPLPCHFALGRNRNHQGLAQAILKLWEKSLVVKIAVKRGIQNTNNKLMSEELKQLTGGTLLLRNKYYIIMYRGKDFLPPTVAATLAERQELANKIQDLEEKVRVKEVDVAPPSQDGGQALAGTLAEFKEAQAQWGREMSAEEREKMIEEATKAQRTRLIKRIEHKISIAQSKKLKAEKLLAKIERTMVPAGPDYDQEIITDEERVMFRRVGLKMKAYLPLGIRGVFDGVIENMHLHWKHRELVKLITKQKTLAFVEDTARLLEFESGGILVAIERVPKGFALIYYRGKNYRRPISLRPRNLLTKAQALKRSVAMQRHEALSQHINELEKTIEQMKNEIGISEAVEDEKSWSAEGHKQFIEASEFTQRENEATFLGSDVDYDEDFDEDGEYDFEDNEDADFSDKDDFDFSKL